MASWREQVNNQVFRPIKPQSPQKSLNDIANYSMKAIERGSVRNAVKLPSGENVNEWIAYNITEIKKQVFTLYATITEFCTEESCPVMQAGAGYRYLWSDGQTYLEPTELSAPEYITLLLNWVEQQFDDESIFPQDKGSTFPDDFIKIVKNIMKRLFRVYAHIYYHHLENISTLKLERHLNTSFKQFIIFSNEFDLIPPDQLEPLKVQVDAILKSEM